jgi:hypothetical protein
MLEGDAALDLHLERRSNMKTEDRVDRMLDHALEMTFPASDPISVYMPETARGENGSPRATDSHALNIT